MSIKSLSEYTYVSKYARYNKDKKRRETWEEAIDRVKQMHLKKYPQIKEEINWAFEQVLAKRVLGSQRALQFGGKPIEKVNARIYNCCFSYADRLRFFQEAFYLLLAGCGTGFSVQKHHVAKLSSMHKPTEGGMVFQIPDSIEGWADSLGHLVGSYFDPNSEYFGYNLEFDYSLIRKKGSPISSGSGKAPGPEPLAKALENIRSLFDRCIKNGQKGLRSIDAYDIVMYSADAVLSGGVRRSATIALFSPDDMEMAKAKTGNWFYENPQRARSNNSALLVRNKTTPEQFKMLMDCVKEFGEPGFVWADSEECGFNPCVEINLYAYDDLGNSGWQFCVAGDTKLITKEGVETIKDCVGKEVEIWNGEKWSKVKPFQTGSNRKLYRVYLSDGSYLDCTSNHKWMVKDRFMKDYKEVETKDLMSVSKYAIHTPRPEIRYENGKQETNAYEYGFLLGDGCANRNDCISKERQPFACLWGEDTQLGLNGRITGTGRNEYGTSFIRMVFDNLDRSFTWKLKYEDGLPKDVFSWDRKSLYDFIAGWIDADGSKQGRGFRIYGRKDKLKDLQLLLTKLGFYSSFCLMADEGEETNLGTRRNAVWYVQVSDVQDLYSRRLKLSQVDREHNGKGWHQVIKKVEELDGLHDTFCLTEEEKHLCVFNNVLTHQCNLCEINGSMLKTTEDFTIAAKAGAIIGTCQAGYTSFPYLGVVSENITRREALLGVSITGMMEHPKITFDPKLQRQMAELIKEVNAELAAKIGLNPAARCTCVKPAGTTSCVLGTSSGIHPHHAKRYFRRVQGNMLESPLAFFTEVNPDAVEQSVWSANKTDSVITFCVEVNDEAQTKKDFGAVNLLEKVKLTQQNWVEAGTRIESCAQPWLRHNVSNTINVQAHEWDDIERYIYNNRQYFAGISLLPSTGDLDYSQAPFCSVSTPSEILEKYGEGSIFASGLIVDGVHAYDDLWKACDAVLGRFKPQDFPQEDWIRRAKQFAERYFNDDIQNMLYCLKEVNNFKLWNDLKRKWKEVDYSSLCEESDETNLVQEVACAGGTCSIF